MNATSLLLGLSAAANAALLVYVFSLPRVSTPSTNSVEHDTAYGASSLSEQRGATQPGVTADANHNIWHALRSDDLPALVHQLRAAGFPPHVLRAIVSAEVRERFAARRKELVAGHPPRGYWEPGRSNTYDPKFMAAYRELDREQSALLRSLLGPDAVSHDDVFLAIQQRRFGHLSPERIDELNRIASDYSDLRSEIYSQINGIMLPADREKLTFIEEEERRDMAALLTPDELLDFELRSSSTANTLRSQLTGFQPSEAEFRQLFLAAREAERRFGALGPGGLSPTGNTKDYRDAVVQALQGQWPAERIAELSQAVDPEYQMPNRLVARLGLTSSAAREIVNVQRDIAQRAGALRSNRELDPAARQAQLEALEKEATQRLTNTLGATGLEAYRNFGGQWLRSLVPPPPRKGPSD